ncbi:putative peptide modification system cyclase [Pseudoxanthomonas koreensis]|uniref:putative peptide modification system cyclase n=1 Tax=Pseudoxanthomonas koreensis TaxID=266061 RepID=UPI001EE3AA3E|nr:putative peptide modification system cyclase [Pseudoxanthomonas koreensis]
MPQHHADAPELRTLLLTDLSDSTALVESLGDGAAAELFRDHDRLVLELQQRWRGRLIDRSDGLLLLFERPLDGLGFALDYRRGLDALGHAHRTGPLLARAGLHVGEVLLWRNSDEAVSVGAKPVEVEGLAKPFTARLMHLARPGQILLSSVAEPLVRRAARELGERGEALQWRSHGRWHFKGVPQVQEVHEVGEPGLAPLRMPRGDGKARRDLPVWRRPLALAAEAVLVAGVAVGVWFMTRPEPAIAFSERDWVVLGDLRNLTGRSVLDDSLEQAFRISLEQSRHVNVLSDLKVQQTLRQMRLDPQEAELDRWVASHVAAREGARAVILPTVSEVGNNVQFSVEVIDPVTLDTVYSERATGAGLESVLDSIDKVTARLRGNLGEAMASIQQSSTPLPDATTSDLEAMRAYALAEIAMGRQRLDDARGLYGSAIRIDPKFARAHLGLASIAWALEETEVARRHVADAVRVRDTLTSRDRLQVDAWQAEVSPGGGSLVHWLTLARLYPDHFGAQSNASWYLLMEARFDEAATHAISAAAAQSPRRSYPLVHLARAYVALGRPDDAIQALEEAQQAGNAPSVLTRSEALLLLGRDGEAIALLEAVKAEESPIMWLHAQRTLASIALGQGDHERAVRLSERARAQAASMQPAVARHYALVDAIVRSAAGTRPSAAELSALERSFRTAMADREMPARYEDLFRYALLTYLAQQDGHAGLAAGWLRWLEPEAAGAKNRIVDKMLVVVRANQLRLEGRLEEAGEMLLPQMDGTELVQVRVVMREVERDRGNLEGVQAQQRWLDENQGRVLAEVAASQVMQVMNVVEAAPAAAAGTAESRRNARAGLARTLRPAGLTPCRGTARSCLPRS